ncbi:PAS domain-containing sensor histidine kinase [Desulfovibrio sp. TomC]|uniref:PAS domain-containing sensor histidine kinase n=1 Tax=Desulfovibrio sp. TomC TaxID=1562888 RepID=UPI000574A8F4|nr:PAS domain-containing sensor histidine kinase [Desulfovibrio sp. TomC]KHK02296.1 Sensor histidine kinase [Desulfovibrio sp. TomC]
MVHARLLESFTAERTPGPTLDRQVRLFAESPAVGILDRLPMGVAVFNTSRQIIYANAAFCTLSDTGRGVADVIGLRLGDALSCLGTQFEDGVCGSTQLCRSCGAAKSLAASLAGADGASGDCSISRQGIKRLDNLDFRIWIWALRHAGEAFHVALMSDIRAEKRLDLMERIFYHDIMNLVSGMQGICELMREEEEGTRNAELDLLLFAVERVTDLILSQRDLSFAERGDYEVTVNKMGTLSLLTDITSLMRRESSCRGKTLVISPDSSDVFFASDRKLLTRILVNMQKNALEATAAGGTVTVGCGRQDGQVRFWVHNAGVVAEEARPQIFRRTFSTKGRGRGLGTYGTKLFAESYLGGTVGFTSEATDGTVFYVLLPGGEPAIG